MEESTSSSQKGFARYHTLNLMQNIKTCLLCLFLGFFFTPVAFSDYKTDIGYTDLQALLGARIPTGAGVKVIQVEVGGTVYAPSTTSPQFTGKTFRFPGAASLSPSDHATGVGSIFYGTHSMANGISDITCYEATFWINSMFRSSVSALPDGSRVVNHSWAGNGNDVSQIGTMLRMLDRQVERNELIEVVTMANAPGVNVLLSGAYNVIAVGKIRGNLDYGSKTVDLVYGAGRTRPDVVAPEPTTSVAAPEVAATAVLLVETGHKGALKLSTSFTTIAGVDTVYNAERVETIKAALMAGADRVTNNSHGKGDISDYRSSGHQTSNGLDDRFCAGQVNALHSFQIIAAGEQNSLEDGGLNAGTIGLTGFDYDNAFGGYLNSNKTATYKFQATNGSKLSASLVWNIDVTNDRTLAAALPNLNLELFDVTTQTASAFSSSKRDNTENIQVDLVAGHSYELLVTSGETKNFSWDYSLAWYIIVQEPASHSAKRAFSSLQSAW